MTISDMSIVGAEVKVDETDITNVRDGDVADVSIDALPGKTFKGTVTQAGDVGDIAFVGAGGDDANDREYAGSTRFQGGGDAGSSAGWAATGTFRERENPDGA